MVENQDDTELDLTELVDAAQLLGMLALAGPKGSEARREAIGAMVEALLNG